VFSDVTNKVESVSFENVICVIRVLSNPSIFSNKAHESEAWKRRNKMGRVYPFLIDQEGSFSLFMAPF
jgi:hypothetical protein